MEEMKMNDVVSKKMETAVVEEPSMKQEIVETFLDTFKQLPKEFQMAFYGVGLISVVGITAFAISQGYGIKKTNDGLCVTGVETSI